MIYSYATSTTFDLPLDGISAMDFFALNGYDVWSIDQRGMFNFVNNCHILGLGYSTKPAEILENLVIPAGDDTLCNSSVVSQDITTIVDMIIATRNVTSVAAYGFSWGTTLMAMVAAENPGKINKLAFYSTQWIRSTYTNPYAGKAYRYMNKTSAVSKWMNQIPDLNTVTSQAWIDAWWDALMATDTWGAAQTPQVLRAPNGIYTDNQKVWYEQGVASMYILFYFYFQFTTLPLLTCQSWSCMVTRI